MNLAQKKIEQRHNDDILTPPIARVESIVKAARDSKVDMDRFVDYAQEIHHQLDGIDIIDQSDYKNLLQYLKIDENHSISSEVQMGAALLGKVPLLDFIEHAARSDMSMQSFSQTLAHASDLSRKENIKKEKVGNLGRNDWLEINATIAYLRASLFPIEYNTIHEKGFYNFSSVRKPNDLATAMTTYCNGSTGKKSIFDNEKALIYGSGNGRDDIALIRKTKVKGIYPIEASEHALDKYKNHSKRLSDVNRSKIHFDETAGRDINRVLDNLVSNKVNDFGVAYSLSTLHYFDDTTFINILRNTRDVLREGGYFVLGIKSLNSRFDDPNQPNRSLLIEDTKREIPNVESSGEVNGTVIGQRRITIGNDGIMRIFRNLPELRNVISKVGRNNNYGFASMMEALETLIDYEKAGEQQEMIRIILKKKKQIASVS